jgi:hypothetical protein
VSTLEVAFCAAPIFLSSHILPVLGERTVLYLNPLKFIVDTEKVTNLGTALDNFLRIPATGFLNDIGNDSGSGNNPAGVGEQVAMWTKLGT